MTMASAGRSTGDALATLIEGLANGEWSRVGPNTTAQPNSLNDAQVARTKRYFDKDGGAGSTFSGTADTDVEAIVKDMLDGFHAWNGCAVGTGARKGKVWFWGQGHADGAGNQVFEIDLNAATPVWAAITDQNPLGTTASPAYPTAGSAQNYYFYPTNAEQANLQAAGSIGPPAGHSYDLLQYDEINDRLWIGSTAIFQQSGTSGGFWYLDFTTGEWVVADTTGFDGTDASIIIAPNFNGDYLFLQGGSNSDVTRYNDGSAARCPVTYASATAMMISIKVH